MVVVAVVSLLAVVTVAAEDLPLRAPRGEDRRPIDLPGLASEVWFSLFTLLLLLGLVMFVLSIASGPARPEESPRKNAFRQYLAIVITILLVLLVVKVIGRPKERSVPPLGVPPGFDALDRNVAKRDPARSFSVALWALLVTAQVGLVAAVLYARRGARGRAVHPGVTDDSASAAQAVLSVSADELEREADPRKAVLGAYQALLAGLAERGVIRRPSETPDELFRRLFAALHVSPGPLERLTSLFIEARFSDHGFTSDHKTSALSALRALQAELSDGAAEIEGPLAIGAQS